MAFWMLTGRSYWRAGNQAEIALTPIFTEVLVLPLEPPSVRAAQYGLAHLVPPTFDAWFFRCVARNHEHRFVDATQAMAALSPHFSLLEASSARRMIPATIAMPSIPPEPASSVVATTPIPRTVAQGPYAGAYAPHPTEPTPPFALSAALGGSLPPGVPLASHPPTAPSHAYPPVHVAHPPSAAPVAPPSAPPHAAPPLGAPPSYAPPLVAQARATTSSQAVPWGVLGALGALLVLGLVVAGAAAWLLLAPPTPRTPPPRTPPPRTGDPVREPPPMPVSAPPTLAQVVPDDDAGAPAEPPRSEPGVGRAPTPRVEEPGRQEPRAAVSSTAPSTEARPAEALPDGARRRFSGAWSGDGWRYRLLLDLERRGAVITGSIRWTLAETPDELYVARVGETATEIVRGTFSSPGLISLEGQSVSDDSLISTDHYELHLGEDGSLVGTAREGGGRLGAQALP
jgi:hypothetical protein